MTPSLVSASTRPKTKKTLAKEANMPDVFLPEVPKLLATHLGQLSKGSGKMKCWQL